MELIIVEARRRFGYLSKASTGTSCWFTGSTPSPRLSNAWAPRRGITSGSPKTTNVMPSESLTSTIAHPMSQVDPIIRTAVRLK